MQRIFETYKPYVAEQTDSDRHTLDISTDLNEQAQEQIKRIISQLKTAEDITKHLESRDQMA